MRLQTIGIFYDGVQDRYVRLFDLEPGKNGAMERRSLNEYSTLPVSSNPGALSNHNFPLRVDSSGVVLLDLRDVEGRARLVAEARQALRVTESARVVVRGFKIP